MRAIIFFIFLAMSCPPLFAQQVYKCRDENGRTTYADEPCEGKEKTVIDATPADRGGGNANTAGNTGRSSYKGNSGYRKTLIVYGRDACGNTRATRQKLTAAGIPFQYKIIDDPAVADPLYKRMRARGIRTESYTLPIVEMNGTFQFNPNREELVQRAKGP